MRKIIGFILLLIIPLFGFNQQLGLPGDNLNLYAVLKAFQESPTLESFEKKLNDNGSKINNLDLDNNNIIDYINVSESIDASGVHLITLQTYVSKEEKQDIAVITVQKINGKPIIQIIGDVELYGKDYIVQPNDKVANTPNPGYTGNVVYQEYNDFNTWPIISYIFMPNYSCWHSRWYWSYYPPYYSFYHPMFYHQYYGYHSNYYYNRYYTQTRVNSYSNWNHYYGYRRNSSNYVIKRRESGEYKKTYSRPDLEKQGQKSYRQDNQAKYSRPVQTQKQNQVQPQRPEYRPVNTQRQVQTPFQPTQRIQTPVQPVQRIQTPVQRSQPPVQRAQPPVRMQSSPVSSPSRSSYSSPSRSSSGSSGRRR